MRHVLIILIVFINSETEFLSKDIIVYSYDSELEYGIEVTYSDYVEPEHERPDHEKTYDYINNQIQQFIFPFY